MNFSLLVPSYNRPEFIRETVLSLLGNSAPDVEVIVSDDASPKRDEIRNSLTDLIGAGKLTYLQQEKNLGWSNNRNALVDAARGEYVILLGDDDRLKPGAIETLRKWTRKYPEISLFGLGYDTIDERGERVFTYCTPKPVCYQISKNEDWKEIFAFDAVPMWSHHPFTMCSKRKVALAIRYKTTVDIADDAVYLYDALEQGHQFMALPEVLFEWRVATDTGASYSSLSGSLDRCYRARGLILAEWVNRPALKAEIKTLLRDPKFLARFCTLKDADAIQLRDLLEVKPADGKVLGDFICDRTIIERKSNVLSLKRLFRAMKVMGFKHILNFLRNRQDRKRLARNRQKKTAQRI
jgi:glycosyltransferase involved in cell wall biosynthesis